MQYALCGVTRSPMRHLPAGISALRLPGQQPEQGVSHRLGVLGTSGTYCLLQQPLRTREGTKGCTPGRTWKEEAANDVELRQEGGSRMLALFKSLK